MNHPNLLVPEKLAVDPAERVLVPTENEQGFFATLDSRVYRRVKAGQIVRVLRKIRGKAARAADKRTRRQARDARLRREQQTPPAETAADPAHG